MKLPLTTLLLSITVFASSQDFTPVDRAQVQKEVTDANSDNYYPKLLKRFNDFDTTLTLQHYRLLYYGYVFQDAYFGYNDDKSKQIRELMGKKQYKEAIEICDAVLKEIPISLGANYLKGLCLFSMDENDPNWKGYRDHYFDLIEAILSTGDGVKCKTAFKTIFVSDEYIIVYQHFEINRVSGQALQTPCDLLKISPSDKFDHKEIFFDTSETFLGMQRKMEKKN